MDSRKFLMTFFLACLSITVSKSTLLEDDVTSVLNSPSFQTWKVQFREEIRDEIRDEIQEEIRKEILQDLNKTDVIRKLMLDVDVNRCKVDEVIPYINETISQVGIQGGKKVLAPLKYKIWPILIVLCKRYEKISHCLGLYVANDPYKHNQCEIFS